MQRRADRAKTPVLLHHADDRAAALKHAQPLLGWLVVDGETALPWSVFQKLVTPALVRPHNRGGKVFADYPHAEVLERSWQALAKVMDFKSSDIFAEAVRAVTKVEDPTPFILGATETWAVEGNILNDDAASPKSRWVPHLQVGMVFRETADGPPNVSAAELLYYQGPYFLEVYRAADKPWLSAAKIIGKALEIDDDPEVCDGPMLADIVATGMADTAWSSLFAIHTEGWDAGPDANLKGGGRMANLLQRFKYAAARESNPEKAGAFLVSLLPAALTKQGLVPLLSIVCKGADRGSDIREAITDLAGYLHLDAKGIAAIGERLIFMVESKLKPLILDISKPSFAGADLAERLEILKSRIEDTKLGVAISDRLDSGSKGDAAGPSGSDLLKAMTTIDAIAQLQRLAEHKASESYSFKARVEMAHSGRPTPEMRAAAMLEAGKLSGAAKAKALADIKAADQSRPLAPLWQLMHGTIKGIMGFPELLDLYDVSKFEMSAVLGTVVARAFSASGSSVPAPLRHLQCPMLESQLRPKGGWKGADVINDADGAQLCHIKQVHISALVRVPGHMVYSDLHQVLRIQRIMAALLAFFGVRPDGERSWRYCTAQCTLAFQWIPLEDMGRQRKIGFAMRTLFTEGLEALGIEIDKVRYSTKCDAEPPLDFLPAGRAGRMEQFTDTLAVMLNDMERDRSEDDSSKPRFISVPRTTTSPVGEHFDGFLNNVRPMHSLRSTPTSPGPLGADGLPDAKRVRFDPLTPPASAMLGTAPTSPVQQFKGTLEVVKLKLLSGKEVQVSVDANGIKAWYKTTNPGHNACLPFLLAVGKESKLDEVESCGKFGVGHNNAMNHCHIAGKEWYAARPGLCHASDADRKILGF